MARIVVTGADGFIGRNLLEALGRRPDVTVTGIDVGDLDRLGAAVSDARIVFHLAGVNRPKDASEFHAGNVELTRRMAELASSCARPPAIVFSSSIQAQNDSPYGTSKRLAEELVLDYGRRTSAPVYVYRLANVFGKWCRPNYNSVVATFCHNLARGLPITIADPEAEIELVYIDKVVAALLAVLDGNAVASATRWQAIGPTYRIRVGELSRKLEAMAAIRDTLVLPDLSDELTRCLHATFVSYLSPEQLSYSPPTKTDHRGSLVELLKSPHVGQIFVSRSKAGVLRGNHYHNSKVEKFCVVQGRAVIKFRAIDGRDVLSYEVTGDKVEVVDIPPGYTHSIRNVGDDEMVVLFWASEIFDPDRPDTYACSVEDKS